MLLDFVEMLKVIFLGIVEGITEWLPISSTGHMLLVDEFIRLDMTDSFKEMFFVVIQLGAILAVVLLFWKKMFPFQFKDKTQPVVRKDIFSLWFKVVAACIPGAVVTLLFDDYVDYKSLPENSQKCKCAYIKEGKATLRNVLQVVMIYFSIAILCGGILFLRCGIPVIGLAIIGGIIALIYAKLSQRGLSEIAVGIAFGPLLFEGTYFVMTKHFSLEVLVLSLAVVMFTIGLMYVHTLLDYEGDMCAHKKTLVCRIGNKSLAQKGVFVVYGLGYLFTVVLAIMTKKYCLLVTFILIPLVFRMYNYLKSYICGGDVNEFYFRLLQARDLMVYYSLLITLFLLF